MIRPTYYPGSPTQSPAFNTPVPRRVYAPGRMEAEVAAAERKVIPLAAVYPGRDRERPAENRPVVSEKYDRGQTLSAAAGTGSVLALVGVYAGKPDVIDLLATGGAAVVELQDRLGLNPIRFTVPINTPFQTQVSRERVTAFNVSDAAPATVIAVGKWALPAPAVEGYRRADADAENQSELGLSRDPEDTGPGY
jgi:hypothetical protein